MVMNSKPMVHSQAPSPFLQPGPFTQANQLAILHLRRDLLTPIILRSDDHENEGYDEGKVTNTRFGSFPHTTLLQRQWGMQVRASAVDTGSRGRRAQKAKQSGQMNTLEHQDRLQRQGQDRNHDIKNPNRGQDQVQTQNQDQDQDQDVKQDRLVDSERDRKRIRRLSPSREHGPDEHMYEDVAFLQNGTSAPVKEAIDAKSGFGHLLPPTPESWTAGLPHRTQVVYTPDYSYILHTIRARPGTRIIEAGAGSGSFTHAAARAVYSGFGSNSSKQHVNGRVFSFEFHKQRFNKLEIELQEHGLTSLVHLTHRDVCNDGFVLDLDQDERGFGDDKITDTPPEPIDATAVFLDLPAPWLALPHLKPRPVLEEPKLSEHEQSDRPLSFPLNPTCPVHLSSFSPCIEQVQRTVSAMRQHGWVDIQVVDIAARRIEMRRLRVGLQEEGLRGVNDTPKDVDEALERLREVDGRTKQYHADVASRVESVPRDNGSDVPGPSSLPPLNPHDQSDGILADQTKTDALNGHADKKKYISKQQRLLNIKAAAKDRKIFREGRLVTRSEPEIKSHTSYLVFATLPRQWSDEDEGKAAEQVQQWSAPARTEDIAHAPVESTQGKSLPQSKRARKKAAREARQNEKS